MAPEERKVVPPLAGTKAVEILEAGSAVEDTLAAAIPVEGFPAGLASPAAASREVVVSPAGVAAADIRVGLEAAADR